MEIRAAILFLALTWPQVLGASDANSLARAIAQKVTNPERYIKEVGTLVTMGNAPLESAKIVFLPEVHDDPQSLLAQLLMIAMEKKNGKSFIVLDESLGSMEKSIWDVFSQKALEIIAAQEQRQEKTSYAPRQFEDALQRLATKFRSTPGQLEFLDSAGIWSLANFSREALPFFGWDIKGEASLTDRNIKMVDSLQHALKNNARVLVMLGARHVPELEYMTSQKLLCQGSRFSDMNNYFNAINRKFGNRPMLQHGIGATAPIHNFLAKQKYAVVFNKGLYNELDDVIKQFKGRNNEACLRLW